MKNIFKNLILAGLTTSFLILISCEDLEEDARSQISTESFYKTEADAVSAVQSIYSDLTHNTSGDHATIYNRLLVLATGILSDDHIPGKGATNPDVRSIGALTTSATSTRYYELWRQHYEAINRANVAIDRIPAITDGNPLVLKRLELEAKFLRGLLYYNLVRLWGDVPLVLHETKSLDNINPSRSAKNLVYTQIISDFTEAAAGLPKKYTGVDAFRATSGAANAFLLSVSVTTHDWARAVNQYNVIQSGGYGYDLFPDFKDNFVVSKENTVEHIFDANYIADGTAQLNGKGNTNILSVISAPYTGFAAGQGVGYEADAPLITLRGKFKANDTRTKVTFNDSMRVSITSTNKFYFPHFYKYWDPAAAANLGNNGVNAPIIRYAEVLLFYAEAQNELGNTSEAYDAFNKVYKRARPTSTGLTTGLTKDQFRDSLFLERQLEFVYEQIRWFDLIRINGSGSAILVPTLKALPDLATSEGLDPNDEWVKAKSKNVSEKFLLLPIPASELQVNPNLTQNPGWN